MSKIESNTYLCIMLYIYPPGKKGKKPAKGTLLAMQEALKKVQEEQERAKKDEEEQ